MEREFSIYDNCREFERQLSVYTGAPHVVVVDNNCNGLFLAMRYFITTGTILEGDEIRLPAHTYVGVPYAIKAARLKPIFDPSPEYLTGEYRLGRLPLWDSALRFTSGMYRPGQVQVLSFTGPFKHLKVQKGGAILTDSKAIADWLRRARFSGRGEMSYHDDVFTHPEGYNMYIPAILATMGAHMMQGVPMHNPDLTMKYPDLSLPHHTAFNT